MAWQWNGSPQTSPIQIKVVVSDSEKTTNLTIKPKPVILVHGLWSNADTWQSYTGLIGLVASVNSNWLAYAVGDGQANGKMDTGIPDDRFHTTNTIAENALELYTYIQEVRKNQNAWQVDIVAHSMGGLISRYYIQNLMPFGEQPAVSRLLMMGTPNGGSVCADIITAIRSSWWSPATTQLRTDYLPLFNQEITERHGVKFAILAGNTYKLPCSSPSGDGIVSVNSVLAIPISDNTSRTAAFHDEMTGSIEEFNLFVKPRLTNVISIANLTEFPLSEEEQVQQNANSMPQLTYGDVIDILPSETQVIQLPQLGGSQLHVLLSNMSLINATLRGPAYTIVDSITANTNEANQLFVSMLANNVTPGIYELELSNVDTETHSVPIGVWVDDDPAQLEIVVTNLNQPNQLILSKDEILIRAAFSSSGNPIPGADLTAQIVDENGVEMLATLLDDGNHEDGQANDGTYGTILQNLASGTYLIKVEAEGSGITRLTSRLIKIASPNKIFLPIVVK